MKSVKRILAIAMFSGLLFAQDVFVNIAYKTKTILSGFTHADNHSLQKEFGFKTNKFNAKLWANYDLKNNAVSEVDIHFYFPLNKLIGIYAGYFTFPNRNLRGLSELEDAQEIGINVSKGIFSLYASGLHWQEGIGEIVKATVGKEFELSDRLTVKPSARVVWNNEYFIDKKGYSHSYVKLEGAWKIGNDYSLKGDITTQKALSPKKFGDTFKIMHYGGVTFEKKF